MLGFEINKSVMDGQGFARRNFCTRPLLKAAIGQARAGIWMNH